MLRTFLIAMLAGACVTLMGLGAAPLVTNPRVPPVNERDPSGTLVEEWRSGVDDRLASTSADGERFPDGIAALQDARLARTTAATMKVRDAAGTVVAVASRFTAPAQDGRIATWWTFVAGARGTLAAHLPDASSSSGVLLGGTREFEGAAGRFVEERRADGSYALRIERPTGAVQP